MEVGLLCGDAEGSSGAIATSRTVLGKLTSSKKLFIPMSIPGLSMAVSRLGSVSCRRATCTIVGRFFASFARRRLERYVGDTCSSGFSARIVTPLMGIKSACRLRLFRKTAVTFGSVTLSVLPRLVVASTEGGRIGGSVIVLATASKSANGTTLTNFTSIPKAGVVIFCPGKNMDRIRRLRVIARGKRGASIMTVRNGFSGTRDNIGTVFRSGRLTTRLSTGKCRFSSTGSVGVNHLMPRIICCMCTCTGLLRGRRVRTNRRVGIAIPAKGFKGVLTTCCTGRVNIPVTGLVYTSGSGGILFSFFRANICSEGERFVLASSPSVSVLVSDGLRHLVCAVTKRSTRGSTRLVARLGRGKICRVATRVGRKLGSFIKKFTARRRMGRAVRSACGGAKCMVSARATITTRMYTRCHGSARSRGGYLITSATDPCGFMHGIVATVSPGCSRVRSFTLVSRLRGMSNFPVPGTVGRVHSTRIHRAARYSTSRVGRAMGGVLKIWGVSGDV